MNQKISELCRVIEIVELSSRKNNLAAADRLMFIYDVMSLISAVLFEEQRHSRVICRIYTH
jgi:hypothetical protein